MLFGSEVGKQRSVILAVPSCFQLHLANLHGSQPHDTAQQNHILPVRVRSFGQLHLLFGHSQVDGYGPGQSKKVGILCPRFQYRS